MNVHHVYLVPAEFKEDIKLPGPELRIVVSHDVGAGHRTWILQKNKKYS